MIHGEGVVMRVKRAAATVQVMTSGVALLQGCMISSSRTLSNGHFDSTSACQHKSRRIALRYDSNYRGREMIFNSRPASPASLHKTRRGCDIALLSHKQSRLCSLGPITVSDVFGDIFLEYI